MLTRLTDPKIANEVNRLSYLAEHIAGCRLTEIHRHYTSLTEVSGRIKAGLGDAVRELVSTLAGDSDYIQAAPNLRIHAPGHPSAVQAHSDHLFGHSASETNYWLAMTPVCGSNSLYLCDDQDTDYLHDFLRKGATLGEFESAARRLGESICSPTPSLWTFCCRQVHGSTDNVTDLSRVSWDVRTIPASAPQGVKRRGGYFIPAKWLRPRKCPLEAGMAVTTVASLDAKCPVFAQRQMMERFHPQGEHRELVEFHGLESSAPVLEDAMEHGPVVAFTVQQIRRGVTLRHPIGFADERVWFLPGDEALMERLREETK